MRLGVLLLAALAAAGCDKQPGDAPAVDGGVRGGDQSRAMSPEEVGQGMQLCRGYVQRVCRCAETRAELREECELAKARPQGLELSVKFMTGSEGPISTRERLEGEAGARKVIAACVKADSALDPQVCPR